MRAVVDTNILVSAVIRIGQPAKLVTRFLHGDFEIVLSQALLRELVIVLARPRISKRYGLDPNELARYVGWFRSRTEVIEIRGTPQGCRDPEDDRVIETAVRGGADYIVTGDNDLLADSLLITKLRSFGIQVVTVRGFLELLNRLVGPGGENGSAGTLP